MLSLIHIWAAATYLAIAVTCGLVLLMGLFLLYGAAGTLEFEALGALVRGAGPALSLIHIWSRA